MFGKFRQDKMLRVPQRFDTLIGPTTEIRGRLVLFDSARIDGKVIGNIEPGKDKKVTVAIGRSGEIVGDITANCVIVAGKIDGNIYAAERAEFHKDAEILGDVTYGSIAVERGAKLMGLIIQNQASPSEDKEMRVASKVDQR